MKPKALIAFLLIISVMFAFGSCKGKDGDENETTTTEISEESTTANPEKETTTHISTTAAGNETTTEHKFIFSAEKASLIGTFYSNLYGNLTFYLQDDKFVFFDETNTQVMLVDTEGYNPSAVSVGISAESDDMNFDGHNDFRLLYRLGTYNSYYMCWLWNAASRTYEYCLPLSSLASPEFDKDNKLITSFDRLSDTQYTVTTYKWTGGSLTQQSKKYVDNQDNTVKSEAADTNAVYSDGTRTATITLTGNPDSASRWICKSADESIVKLIADTYDASTSKFTFILEGEKPGKTTVVFRYATGWDADFVSEASVDVTVDNNLNVTLKVTA